MSLTVKENKYYRGDKLQSIGRFLTSRFTRFKEGKTDDQINPT